ncbi:MAG: AAA family ATPase, partial [Pseudomonadales bacterium]|nr:AAA family ATPase [Pseudomonadales bacterium]
MYLDYFGLKAAPFSIAPDPRYLFMSERHKEALAHLLYGVTGQGGFVLLTGEVGTGKTTVCRCFLEQIPDKTEIAFIVNPKLTARELLAAVCDEFKVEITSNPQSGWLSVKEYTDALNQYLLREYERGHHTVLIIDEAQNLSIDVLEQLRLLTNLETSEKKLLQIILLGQPELLTLLAKPELRQLSQRVTARYHLSALSKAETAQYLAFRLSVAGMSRANFTPSATAKVYKLSQGIPRLINLIADRAMLGAYAADSPVVEAVYIKAAAKEVLGQQEPGPVTAHTHSTRFTWLSAVLSGAAGGLMLLLFAVVFKLGITQEAREAKSAAYIANNQRDREGKTSETKPAPISEVLLSGNQSFDQFNLSWLALGRSEAYQSLFKQWNLDWQEDSSPCDYALNSGLDCLEHQGNWRSLRQLNRPAILTLYDTEGGVKYLPVVGVSDQAVTVAMGDQELVFSRDQIDRHWLGEFTLIW